MASATPVGMNRGRVGIELALSGLKGEVSGRRRETRDGGQHGRGEVGEDRRIRHFCRRDRKKERCYVVLLMNSAINELVEVENDELRNL